MSSGLITFPRDLDILTPPSPKIIPCEVRFMYGSFVGTSFKSYKNLCQKREYKRCRVVCSFPPLYQSTPPISSPKGRTLDFPFLWRGLGGGVSQYFKFFLPANSFLFFGSAYRR